ncbi:putative transporter [Lachnellula cervina]|uniref:Putative transporter n=1 Tax=Lachnellula cervina TaxID=1316786 RepID=A0A7D8YMR2_9HELO|nr:putative transporter [Lachnellula cervina]
MTRTKVMPPTAGDFDALEAMEPTEYAAKEKRLVRKIDLRLMPCLIFMIVLKYNFPLKSISIETPWRMPEFRESKSLSVFMAINLILASRFFLLPVCMAVWGIVSGLTAAVHNYTGLVLVRFFLGFVEAEELALRTSILYAGSLLSGGFGGLVGAGVQAGLNGTRGIVSWRWLFIIEGSVTVFVSICASTRWLSQEERAIATKRLQYTSGSHDTERGSLFSGVKMAVMDYKVTSAGAVTSFIPTLVATFNYSRVDTLLLVAPPYVFATIIALAISYSSDKRHERCFHIVVPIFFGMAGFIIAASTTILAARYLSLFLMLGGVYGSYNVALAWISSTLPRPVEKRAAAIALVNTVGNIAQIYSPYMYPKSDGPKYLTAMICNAAFCVACIAVTLGLRWCLMNENDKLQLLEEQSAADAADFDGVKAAREEIVDVNAAGGLVVLNPGFRYAL